MFLAVFSSALRDIHQLDWANIYVPSEKLEDILLFLIFSYFGVGRGKQESFKSQTHFPSRKSWRNSSQPTSSTNCSGPNTNELPAGDVGRAWTVGGPHVAPQEPLIPVPSPFFARAQGSRQREQDLLVTNMTCGLGWADQYG